jgi:putative SOS response-associated peptidase YedK
MVPRRRTPLGVKVFDTMNARAESVGEKRSFNGAWKSFSSVGSHVRASTTELRKRQAGALEARHGGRVAAGSRRTWREWEEPDAPVSLSFTMLTVNANDHPLMKRFHNPGDEKRSVVIVPPTTYEDWLNSKSTDGARSFLNLYPVDEMAAEPHPLPPRKPAAKQEGDLL